MYNTINKANEFFLWNLYDNKQYYIGNKEDLIKEIARNVQTFGYKDFERWSCDYFSELNLTGKDRKNVFIDYTLQTKQPTRKYLFYDGENRIIDILNFKQEIINKVFALNNKNTQYFMSIFKRKRKIRMGRPHYNYNGYHHKMPKLKSVSTFAAIPEYKMFIKGKEKNNLPYWLDDTSRRIQSNWKRQYKSHKQWGKNVKDTNSIRFSFIEEENFDMDELLIEDFYN